MMEWTDDLVIKFINAYENYPILWDVDHRLYKLKHKKIEAWKAIEQRLGVKISELKKKMSSLLATYRKVRQKAAKANGDGDPPIWFAYKAFAFLHTKYQPRLRNAAKDDLEEESDSPHGKTASAFDDESESFVVDNPEPELEIRNKEIPPPKLQCPAQQFVVIDPPKQKRVFLQPKRILHNRVNCFDASSAASTTTTAIRTRTKREHSPESGSSTNNNNDTTDEGLIIGETYTTLKDGERKRDEFDAYGEYIAKLLRSLDRSTRAFLKKDFGEAIFKAESGFYASQFNSQNCTQQYSRLSAVNYSPQTSRVPSPKSPTIITGSQDVDVNQHILPAHEPASQQLELVWGNPNC